MNNGGGKEKGDGPNNPDTWRFKLILSGETMVGKSCLILRFIDRKFYENTDITIGAGYFKKTITVGDVKVSYEIWDTAGQERYDSLATLYYRGAHAAIIVYDITCAHSFERAQTWVNKLRKQAYPDIAIALAGNKSDLSSQRVVDTKDAQAFADKNSLIFMETSVKLSINVDEIFYELAEKLLETKRSTGVDFASQGVTLEDIDGSQKSGKCKC